MTTSRRPYLIRAMYDWLVDNDFSPHLLVDIAVEGVQVPPGYAQDGKIVLNVSPTAVRGLSLENDGISFEARFSGRAMTVWVPVHAVLAVDQTRVSRARSRDSRGGGKCADYEKSQSSCDEVISENPSAARGFAGAPKNRQSSCG